MGETPFPQDRSPPREGVAKHRGAVRRELPNLREVVLEVLGDGPHAAGGMVDGHIERQWRCEPAVRNLSGRGVHDDQVPGLAAARGASRDGVEKKGREEEPGFHSGPIAMQPKGLSTNVRRVARVVPSGWRWIHSGSSRGHSIAVRTGAYVRVRSAS